MLKPINTDKTNMNLGAPKGWDNEKDGECIGLPVHFDMENNIFTSHWLLSDEQRDKVAKGGLIKLQILGQRHPPVAIDIDDKL